MSLSDHPEDGKLLSIATSLIPELHRSTKDPVKCIVVKRDDSATGMLRPTERLSQEDDGRSIDRLLAGAEELIVDFEGHQVGTISFELHGVDDGIDDDHLLAKIKLTFAEKLYDLVEPFEPFETMIPRSSLPEIELTLDRFSQRVVVPGQWSFRWVKINVIKLVTAAGIDFKAQIQSIQAHTLSSAPSTDLPPLSFGGRWAELLTNEEKTALREIDRVSLIMLRDCSQTVFEDGSGTEDARLAIGDLRLQALASYSTFGNYQLAKRCLYLIASLSLASGRLPAAVFEKPIPCRSQNYFVDYGLLFCTSLLDYVEASGDLQAGHDLYASALAQFSFAFAHLNEDDVISCPVFTLEDLYGDDTLKYKDSDWHFVDLLDLGGTSLDKSCSAHCILIYTLRSLVKLESILSLTPLTHVLPCHPDQLLRTGDLIEKLLVSGRKAFWDQEKGVYVSGVEKQISWASSIWAVLAGLPESQEQGAKALRAAYNDDKVSETATTVTAMTSYLHHYLCEAFIEAGLEGLAVKHIRSYWGSATEAGSHSLFENWNTTQPRDAPCWSMFASPAWNCSPSLLFRKMQMDR